MKVANPKIYCDRSLGNISEGPPEKTHLPSLIISKLKATRKIEEKVDEFQRPTRKLPGKQTTNSGILVLTNKDKKETDDSNGSLQRLSPIKSEKMTSTTHITATTNKRKRIFGPEFMPQKKPSQPPTVSSLVSSKNKHVGTLSFLNHSTASGKCKETGGTGRENAVVSKNRGKETSYGQLFVNPSTIDTWRPPEGQDGTGKTKLNEKYAGRY